MLHILFIFKHKHKYSYNRVIKQKAKFVYNVLNYKIVISVIWVSMIVMKICCASCVSELCAHTWIFVS